MASIASSTGRTRTELLQALARGFAADDRAERAEITGGRMAGRRFPAPGA
jgi:hypothetical protein